MAGRAVVVAAVRAAAAEGGDKDEFKYQVLIPQMVEGMFSRTGNNTAVGAGEQLRQAIARCV
jgi:hypothetical protein